MGVNFDLPEMIRAERAGRAMALAIQADARAEVTSSLPGAAALAATRHLANLGYRVEIIMQDFNAHAHDVFASMLEAAGCMNLPLRQAGKEEQDRKQVARIDGTDFPAKASPADNTFVARDFLTPGQEQWDGYSLHPHAKPNPFLKPADKAAALPTSRIREIDRAAMEDFGLPGVCLMENAGIGATVIAAHMLEQNRGQCEGTVTVVVGFGNNGGDGLVVARGLLEQGCEVRVLMLGDPEKLRGDAEANFKILAQASRVILGMDRAESRIDEILRGSRLVVDAIFGTGLTRAVAGRPAAAIRAMNATGAPILALDIPSGLDADTGGIMGCAIRADTTVTFAAPKQGFWDKHGPEHCGRVFLVDIGCPVELLSN